MNINHKSHSVFKGYETYEVFMTTRRGVLNVTGFYRAEYWEQSKVTVTPIALLIASFEWLKLEQIPGTFWLLRYARKRRRYAASNHLEAGENKFNEIISGGICQ